MAQDFFLDPTTDDWALENGTTIRLCASEQELTRQLLLINLSLFFGEWFANTTIGIPYFESIFGKNTQNATDAIFRSAIRNTVGVISITKFLSSVSTDRIYTLNFSVLSESGPIQNIEVTI